MPDDDSRPLLPVTSPRVQEALERIMRDAGFTEDLIRSRFPNPPDETTYPPEAIRVLEGMTPRRRPAGHDTIVDISVELHESLRALEPERSVRDNIEDRVLAETLRKDGYDDARLEERFGYVPTRIAELPDD